MEVKDEVTLALSEMVGVAAVVAIPVTGTAAAAWGEVQQAAQKVRVHLEEEVSVVA